MAYHSNYFEGGASHRKDLKARLELLKRNMKATGRLLDVGTSGGYYSFGLSDTFDEIIAIDNVPSLIDECKEIQDKHGTSIDFRTADVTDILEEGPWDCILYLSVHHHVITKYDMEEASRILMEVSKKSPLMFFDMGQKNENCPGTPWWPKLPPAPDQEQWLREYIAKYTRYDNIELIGWTPIHGINRLLWKLST